LLTRIAVDSLPTLPFLPFHNLCVHVLCEHLDDGRLARPGRSGQDEHAAPFRDLGIRRVGFVEPVLDVGDLAGVDREVVLEQFRGGVRSESRIGASSWWEQAPYSALRGILVDPELVVILLLLFGDDLFLFALALVWSRLFLCCRFGRTGRAREADLVVVGRCKSSGERVSCIPAGLKRKAVYALRSNTAVFFFFLRLGGGTAGALNSCSSSSSSLKTKSAASSSFCRLEGRLEGPAWDAAAAAAAAGGRNAEMENCWS
jgi:hypothetical protein